MKKSVLLTLILMFGFSSVAEADMITNNGRELRVLLDDVSKLTPEQLLMLRDIAKDQLKSAEKLTELDVNAILAAKRAEEDRKLASRVIYAAFLFVGIVIAALVFPYIRRRP